MPTAAPRLCACGSIIPAGQRCPRCATKRVRTDAIDRTYGTQAWRKTALSVIWRDRGICHVCGKPGADTAHHVIEKRHSGSDDPSNLRAVHRSCHNRTHGHRGKSD
ncbi:MAG: HNH endonuclease [Rhodospirillales bacterium]|nr:MAG: HNH endonuclease [Rhodospirillales bacterium]